MITRRTLLSLLPAAGAVPDGCWIQYRGNERRWVTGQRIGSFLIHKAAMDRAWIEEDGWTVTHIPTGCAVRTHLYFRESAVKVARELEPVLDWSKVREPKLPDTPEVRRAKSITLRIADEDEERWYA